MTADPWDDFVDGMVLGALVGMAIRKVIENIVREWGGGSDVL